jgi:hypothetical protein
VPDAGGYEAEQHDRPHSTVPKLQEQLAEAVLAAVATVSQRSHVCLAMLLLWRFSVGAVRVVAGYAAVSGQCGVATWHHLGDKSLQTLNSLLTV